LISGGGENFSPLLPFSCVAGKGEGRKENGGFVNRREDAWLIRKRACLSSFKGRGDTILLHHILSSLAKAGKREVTKGRMTSPGNPTNSGKRRITFLYRKQVRRRRKESRGGQGKRTDAPFRDKRAWASSRRGKTKFISLLKGGKKGAKGPSCRLRKGKAVSSGARTTRGELSARNERGRGGMVKGGGEDFLLPEEEKIFRLHLQEWRKGGGKFESEGKEEANWRSD